MKSTKKPTHFFEKNKTIDDPTDANDKIIAYYKILALIFLVLMKQKCCFCIKVRKFFPFKCEPVRFFCFVFFFFFWNSPIERLTPWKKKKWHGAMSSPFSILTRSPSLQGYSFRLFVCFVCLFRVSPATKQTDRPRYPLRIQTSRRPFFFSLANQKKSSDEKRKETSNFFKIKSVAITMKTQKRNRKSKEFIFL